MSRESIQIKFKKLNTSAVIPSFAKVGDAGLDLTCVSISSVDNKEEKFGYIEYGTGLAVEIPEGYVGLLYPRSSISNTGLILANAVGVVDSGYRGEIKCRFKHIRDSKQYFLGDRVCQLIVMPYPKVEILEVEELSSTERGDTGFGSTNK